MKIQILVILVTLIFLSCKTEKDNPNPKFRNNTYNDQIQQQIDQKIKFDKHLMSILKHQYLDDTILNNNQKIIRFIKTDAYQNDVSIIDIYDKTKYEIVVQSTNYSFDNDCNPVVGSKKLTKDCIKIIAQKESNISEKEYQKLLQLLTENEIWDLKKKESEIFGYNGILYHGETWSLEIRYCYEEMTNDSTICKTQRISRIFPEKFKGIHSVGNTMLSIAKGNTIDNIR